jgi:hypothetical protein
MYRITATANAVIESDHTSSSYVVPQFLLNGYVKSEEDAVRVAKEIIDPLNITTVDVTVERVPDDVREKDVAAVREQLVNAARALDGDSSYAVNRTALFGLAEAVAMLLGTSLDELTENGEDE